MSRPVMLPEVLRVRLAHGTQAALARAAAQQGIACSEFIRAALQKALADAARLDARLNRKIETS